MATMRMNISLDQDLKNKMDAVPDKPNWSAIAAKAFEDYLIAQAMGRMGGEEIPMESVVERLRRSKEKSDDSKRKEGIAEGKQWAMRDADAEQLELLEGEYNPQTDSWSFEEYEHLRVWFFCLFGDPWNYGPEVTLGNSEWQDAEEWWGDNWENAKFVSFVLGFAEGALDVWDEVKSSLKR